MSASRIVVIGDGIVGLSIAWRLSASGAAVSCIGDGRHPASDAAAGMLAPSFERFHPRAASALGGLLSQGLDHWDRFARELVAETGADIGYSRKGIIGIGFARRLDRGWTAADAPADFTSDRAFLAADEGQADPRRLRTALFQAVRGREVEMIVGHADTISRDGSALSVHVGREHLTADRVVVATGHGATRLLGDAWQEEGVRGRAFLQYAPELDLPTVVRSPTVYFCPKGDGLVYVGATEEVPAGEPAMLDGLWWEALALCPQLAKTERVRTFDGVRPALASGLPEIGQWAEDERILLAFGHDRNGVLLAPLTAARIERLIGESFGQR